MMKGFLDSNPDLRISVFTFREIDMKVCFPVKLTFAWYESDVKSKNLSRDFDSLTWKLQPRYLRRMWSKYTEMVFFKMKLAGENLHTS